jgi:hypothetical protein
MKVKNYYKMSKKECVQSLHKINDWMFNYPNHKRYSEALFANQVCLNAIELKRDQFIQYIIDFIT